MKVQVLHLTEPDYLRFEEIATEIAKVTRSKKGSEHVHRMLGEFLSRNGLFDVIGDDIKFCTLALRWSNFILLTVERVSITYCIVATRQ